MQILEFIERNYLDRLIRQVNCSYASNCYDAAAVLMRRLFEVLLVLSYQHFGIDDRIKDSSGKGYVMLEGIVKDAIFGEAATKDQVNGVFSREKLWFKTKKEDNRTKRKLLNQGISFAESLKATDSSMTTR